VNEVQIRDARREAAREARVRRELRSSGYTLRKSRRADSAGTYAVIDPFRNWTILGDANSGYGYSLDEIEEWLAPDETTAD
jgi:hypothetical protein